jgi:hypothetical protein
MSPDRIPSWCMWGWRARIIIFISSFYVIFIIWLMLFLPNNLSHQVEMICTSVLILGSATCTLERNTIMHNWSAKAQPFLCILWLFRIVR